MSEGAYLDAAISLRPRVHQGSHQEDPQRDEEI